MVDAPTPIKTADTLLQNQSTQIYQTTKVRKYVLLSLLVPPVGLLLSLKERILHLVLPPVLIAESFAFAVSVLVTIPLVKPVLKMLNIENAEIFTGFYWWSLAILLAVFIGIGILSGFYFKNILKKEGHLPAHGVWVMVGLLIIHYILGIVLAIYLNNTVVASFGDLNKTLEDLQQTQQFLQ